MMGCLFERITVTDLLDLQVEVTFRIFQERLDLTLEIFEWLRPPLELWNAAMACQDRFIHGTWLDSMCVETFGAQIHCNINVFLGPNFESSARATGNRPYSSSQVRCYAKLKSYQPTSQHLTCQLEVSGLQQVGNLRLCHVTSFISNVKCFEFDVTGSPAHLLTFRCCHLMHFPTIWWWKHVKWVSSSVHREHVECGARKRCVNVQVATGKVLWPCFRCRGEFTNRIFMNVFDRSSRIG